MTFTLFAKVRFLKKTCVYMYLTFVQSCGRTLPLHANQPRQPALPCAHDNPWPGKWGQSLAFGQEPRPWGPERGRAWQQDGIWDLLDEAASNKGGSTLHILFTILDLCIQCLLSIIDFINIKQNNTEAQFWPLLCYCREHCKSLWMICLRPCSALCAGAPPCPWQSSICLISWTSRPTDMASTTWVFATPGRAIGEKEREHFPSKHTVFRISPKSCSGKTKKLIWKKKKKKYRINKNFLKISTN